MSMAIVVNMPSIMLTIQLSNIQLLNPYAVHILPPKSQMVRPT